jgi:hypothetical protein
MMVSLEIELLTPDCHKILPNMELLPAIQASLWSILWTFLLSELFRESLILFIINIVTFLHVYLGRGRPRKAGK